MAKKLEISGLGFQGIQRNANFLDTWNGKSPNMTQVKKFLRNFETSNGSIFKKLWGLRVEVVSYKKEWV